MKKIRDEKYVDQITCWNTRIDYWCNSILRRFGAGKGDSTNSVDNNNLESGTSSGGDGEWLGEL